MLFHFEKMSSMQWSKITFVALLRKRWHSIYCTTRQINAHSFHQSKWKKKDSGSTFNRQSYFARKLYMQIANYVHIVIWYQSHILIRMLECCKQLFCIEFCSLLFILSDGRLNYIIPEKLLSTGIGSLSSIGQ